MYVVLTVIVIINIFPLFSQQLLTLHIDLPVIITITITLHIYIPVIFTITLNTTYKSPRYFHIVLTVFVTITGRSICSVNSYCENNGNIYICSASSYCDNNCTLHINLPVIFTITVNTTYKSPRYCHNKC
jgi:hypothetical protein